MGDTRPDYGRNEVRQYIFDNVFMWLEEYHVDGLRFDGTAYIHSFLDPAAKTSPGWSLLQWINSKVAEEFPEDHDRRGPAEQQVAHQGLGQAEPGSPAVGRRLVHPIREAVITHEDEHRSVIAIRDALSHRYNDDAFERVIYSESHDEVANGRARVPQEVNPKDPKGW